MADTIRTIAALQSLFADNTSGDISAQDLRDFLVSTYRPQEVNGFRLTTESGVPVSTSDRTAQSTIYLTPFSHNCIGLYDGSSWELRTTAEISLALSGLTSGKNYDVFVYNNSGTLTLEALVWTDDTTRATALAVQDGVYVKTGATTRRYVGTFRTTGTTTTEDSAGGTTNQTGGKRFLWNAYNQVPRQMAVIDTTDNWSYGTDTVRQANAASGNKVEYVSGLASTLVQARALGVTYLATNSLRAAKVGIGVDSTSAFSGIIQGGYNTASTFVYAPVTGSYRGYPGLGYHYLAWCEKGADGTSAFLGDNAADGQQTGVMAELLG